MKLLKWKNPFNMQGDTMKWVMIAAAAGLVFWYLNDKGYIDRWFNSAGDTDEEAAKKIADAAAAKAAEAKKIADAAAAKADADRVAAGGGTAPFHTGANPNQAEPIEAARMTAAYDAGSANLTGDWKTGFDAWNYYRSLFVTSNGGIPGVDKNIPVPSPESVGVVDRAKLITATEYHAILTGAGLKGLPRALQGFSGLAALIGGGGYSYQRKGGWN